MDLPSSPAYRIHQGETIITQIFSGSSVSIRGSFRVTYDDGTEDEIVIRTFAATPTRSGETAPTTYVASQNGYILTGVIYISGDSASQPNRGQTFIRCFIVPSPTSTTPVQMLVEAYLYQAKGVSLGDIEDPGPGGGEGHIRTVTGADPDAGDEVIEAAPANVIWRLINFSAVFVASATGANRVPRLASDDGVATNRYWLLADSGANPVIANETRTVLWIQGERAGLVPQEIADTETVLIKNGIPKDFYMREGDRVRTLTELIEVDDDYAAPIFMVEEWIKL